MFSEFMAQYMISGSLDAKAANFFSPIETITGLSKKIFLNYFAFHNNNKHKESYATEEN